MWTLCELMRDTAFFLGAYFGLNLSFAWAALDTTKVKTAGRGCCPFQMHKGPPRAAPFGLLVRHRPHCPNSHHAGGVLLQRPHVREQELKDKMLRFVCQLRNCSICILLHQSTRFFSDTMRSICVCATFRRIRTRRNWRDHCCDFQGRRSPMAVMILNVLLDPHLPLN